MTGGPDLSPAEQGEQAAYIEEEMRAHGFEFEQTGGGCTAWTRARTDADPSAEGGRGDGYDGGEVIISSDLSAYGDPYAKVWEFGVTGEGANGGEQSATGLTLAEALAFAAGF